MAAHVRWFGDVLGRRLTESAAGAVKRAGTLLMTRARLLASKPAKRIRRKRRRATTGGRKGSQYTQFVPSAPGSPPALRTGFGRRNIDMEFYPRRLIARVGVRQPARYMIYLELGTRHIRPRPWLQAAVNQTQAAIEAILRTGLQQAGR